MPFVISYPNELPKEKRIDDLILNIDIPSLLLDFAGISQPDSFQGYSFKNNLLNEDKKSRDYETIKNKFRPGHADYTYFKKYGIRDYRGGGRQSARETASRVAAGGIAKQILKFILGKKYDVVGGVTQLGILGSNPENWNEKFIKKNQLFCPDKSVLKLWEKYLLSIRKAGSSCGAIIEIRAKGCLLYTSDAADDC